MVPSVKKNILGKGSKNCFLKINFWPHFSSYKVGLCNFSDFLSQFWPLPKLTTGPNSAFTFFAKPKMTPKTKKDPPKTPKSGKYAPKHIFPQFWPILKCITGSKIDLKIVKKKWPPKTQKDHGSHLGTMAAILDFFKCPYLSRFKSYRAEIRNLS